MGKNVFRYFVQRTGVCDVFATHRSKNMGERSATSEPHTPCCPTRAHTLVVRERSGVSYTFLFFIFLARGASIIKVQNKIFFNWGGGQRGIKGVNALRPKRPYCIMAVLI